MKITIYIYIILPEEERNCNNVQIIIFLTNYESYEHHELPVIALLLRKINMCVCENFLQVM